MANSAEGHELLVAAIRELPGPVKVGFEATGGVEKLVGAYASIDILVNNAGLMPLSNIVQFKVTLFPERADLGLGLPFLMIARAKRQERRPSARCST